MNWSFRAFSLILAFCAPRYRIAASALISLPQITHPIDPDKPFWSSLQPAMWATKQEAQLFGHLCRKFPVQNKADGCKKSRACTMDPAFVQHVCNTCTRTKNGRLGIEGCAVNAAITACGKDQHEVATLTSTLGLTWKILSGIISFFETIHKIVRSWNQVCYRCDAKIKSHVIGRHPALGPASRITPLWGQNSVITDSDGTPQSTAIEV